MEINNLYNYYKQSYRVTTDTRSDLRDSIFFGLKGDNFNGNLYAQEALNKGANYAVVDEEKFKTNDKIILVKDVLKTLQNLAKHHRQQLNIPIIALTGSNGKTTTKELINVVLKQKFECKSTLGNLNNHIGVPLTLLSMKPNIEIGVVEMGANHPNEIALLCDIALPDFGYITNFGKVHLEGFGSLEGVIEAKTELYRHLQKREKFVFINTDDSIQVQKSKSMNKITFCSENSMIPVKFLEANPNVNVKLEDLEIYSKLIGKYNFSNIAAAIAIGKYMDISIEKIKEAIENYVPSNNRSQIIVKGNNEIILDAYNANPDSMKVAIENLSQLTVPYKVAILGDMFEVGEDTINEHSILVEQAIKSNINNIYLIGEYFSKAKIRNQKISVFKTFEEFKKNFNISKIKNATILIKASRGMALERVLDLL